MQPGVARLAHRTGLPVVPVGIAAGRAWEFSSWDRFLVPAPFTDVATAVGRPIEPSAYATAEDLVPALRVALSAVTSQARQALR